MTVGQKYPDEDTNVVSVLSIHYKYKSEKRKVLS